jgi:hypothetical protein
MPRCQRAVGVSETYHEKEEPSMEPVVKVSHITFGVLLGLPVQA